MLLVMTSSLFLSHPSDMGDHAGEDISRDIRTFGMHKVLFRVTLCAAMTDCFGSHEGHHHLRRRRRRKKKFPTTTTTNCDVEDETAKDKFVCMFIHFSSGCARSCAVYVCTLYPWCRNKASWHFEM